MPALAWRIMPARSIRRCEGDLRLGGVLAQGRQEIGGKTHLRDGISGRKHNWWYIRAAKSTQCLTASMTVPSSIPPILGLDPRIHVPPRNSSTSALRRCSGQARGWRNDGVSSAAAWVTNSVPFRTYPLPPVAGAESWITSHRLLQNNMLLEPPAPAAADSGCKIEQSRALKVEVLPATSRPGSDMPPRLL